MDVFLTVFLSLLQVFSCVNNGPRGDFYETAPRIYVKSNEL